MRHNRCIRFFFETRCSVFRSRRVQAIGDNNGRLMTRAGAGDGRNNTGLSGPIKTLYLEVSSCSVHVRART